PSHSFEGYARPSPERNRSPAMALWKEPVKSPATAAPETTEQTRHDIPENNPETAAPVQPAQPAPRPALAAVAAKPKAASLIAPDIKIEGAGHVRIAGNFKGDVSVRGDLTIEPGAKVSGSVRTEKVTIGGELGGN